MAASDSKASLLQEDRPEHGITIGKLTSAFISWQPIVGLIVSSMLPVFAWLAHEFTEPNASRVCYCDSAVHFNSVGDRFTFMQYEVRNSGPGDVDDAKLVAIVLPGDVAKIKHSAMYGGYSDIIPNGTTTELVVSSCRNMENDSPLSDGGRIGMELAVTGDISTIPSFNSGDPKLGVFLRRSGYEDVLVQSSARVEVDQSPYWLAVFAGIAMAGMVIGMVYWSVFVKTRAETASAAYIDRESAKIAQHAAKNAARALSESEHLKVSLDEAMKLLTRTQSKTHDE